MYRLPLILALSAIAAGCASTSSVSPSPDRSITINQRGGDRVSFHNVQHKMNADGQSIIHGALKRIDTRHLHSGHIDYQVIDKSNDQVIESGKVAYTKGIKQVLPTKPSLQKRIKKRASYFEIPLKHSWQPGQYRLYLDWDNASHSAQS